MPLHAGALISIRTQLESIAPGTRVGLIEIGVLTPHQFNSINVAPSQLGLQSVESPVLVYLGRHHFVSRTRQGYGVADLLTQLEFAMAADALPHVSMRGTCLLSCKPRHDGYGNEVVDQAILEATARKPSVEVFSVIPKGDRFRPETTKPRTGL